MRSFDLNSGRIIAALGPTNTGKTHRALERMLAHPSGMIGLPLRLLAQEVHARLERERPGQVALITGEQKIIPMNPRYWVCTVEAMPLDVPVHFMAIDEVQLAGQRNRGHTFTERLLHARGVRETWFMGSDTIAPLLQQLVPTAEIQQAKRMSTLRYTGPRKLLSLPKRSAVVAFSAEQVYETAERLRRKHGGAAVVLGALSPRARNAQVALYESGEVDYLVATDAIGMGLNLDVDHVALAATRKFDGWTMRDLRVDELAQIAGRAGRFTRNGTFGTLNSVGVLDPEAVHAIEQHRFPALRSLYWRNNALDFGSLSAPIAGLPWDGRLDTWYSYDSTTHVLAPLPGVYAIDRGGQSYLLEMLDYYHPDTGSSGHPQFRVKAVDPAPPSKVTHSNASGIRNTQVDARDGTVTLRLASGAPASTANPELWDLSFDRFNVLEEGVTVEILEGVEFTSLTSTPSDAAFQDTLSEWYDYDGQTHTLSPKEQVYVVRAGIDYKLQFFDYYAEGEGGFVSFQWAPLELGL